MIKGGVVAAAQMGERSASILIPQPIHYRRAPRRPSTPTRRLGAARGFLKVHKKLLAVENTRDGLRDKSMFHPRDPEHYAVMAQSNSLF